MSYCPVHMVLWKWGKLIPELNNAHEHLRNLGKQVGNSGKGLPEFAIDVSIFIL